MHSGKFQKPNTGKSPSMSKCVCMCVFIFFFHYGKQPQAGVTWLRIHPFEFSDSHFHREAALQRATQVISSSSYENRFTQGPQLLCPASCKSQLCPAQGGEFGSVCSSCQLQLSSDCCFLCPALWLALEGALFCLTNADRRFRPFAFSFGFLWMLLFILTLSRIIPIHQS